MDLERPAVIAAYISETHKKLVSKLQEIKRIVHSLEEILIGLPEESESVASMADQLEERLKWLQEISARVQNKNALYKANDAARWLMIIATSPKRSSEETWRGIDLALESLRTFTPEIISDERLVPALNIVRLANANRLKSDWGLPSLGIELDHRSVVTAYEAAFEIIRRVPEYVFEIRTHPHGARGAYLLLLALPDLSVIKAEMEIENLNVINWLRDPEARKSKALADEVSRALPDPPPLFLPLEGQILDALDGKALTVEQLGNACGCVHSRFYETPWRGNPKQHVLGYLKSIGAIMHDPKMGGYYRPDQPPTVGQPKKPPRKG
jgi:hypothetical protein